MFNRYSKVTTPLLALVLSVGLSSPALAVIEAGGGRPSSESQGSDEYAGKIVGVTAGKMISGTTDGSDPHGVWGGVIKFNLYDDNGEVLSQAGAFCTDHHHPTSLGEKYNTSNEKMSCEVLYLVNNYPAQRSGIGGVEGAARQAAVWHFADGFDPTAPSNVKARAEEIIEDVEAKATTAYCQNAVKPMNVAISPDHQSAFEGQDLTFSVSVTQNEDPVSGVEVNLSTDFGALSSSTVTTDSTGKATFSVSASSNGTANIKATVNYEMPAGSILHALDYKRQKLVLAEPTPGTASATATGIFPAQGSIAVNVFHDRDMDCVKDEGEEYLSFWDVNLGQMQEDEEGGDSVKSILNTLGTSEENGLANFENVENGDYKIDYELKDGWSDVQCGGILSDESPEKDVTVDNDSHLLSFGVIRFPVVELCVFHDKNMDGVQNDEASSLIKDVPVRLVRANGSTVIGTETTTDADGKAVLTFDRASDYDVGGKNYFVEVDLPSPSWSQSMQDAWNRDVANNPETWHDTNIEDKADGWLPTLGGTDHLSKNCTLDNGDTLEYCIPLRNLKPNDHIVLACEPLASNAIASFSAEAAGTGVVVSWEVTEDGKMFIGGKKAGEKEWTIFQEMVATPSGTINVPGGYDEYGILLIDTAGKSHTAVE